jgi:hypothetical protein
MPKTYDLFAPLVRDANGVVFELPADVRRRGSRRRLRRQVAVAGFAALIVVSVGVGSAWAFGRLTGGPEVAVTPTPTQTAGPSPSPTATTEPSPTASPADSSPSTGTPAPPAEIPLAALLQPTDVGTGYITSDAQEGDDHGSIAMMMSYCGEGNYSTAAEHRLTNHKRSVRESDQLYVLEEVSLYEPTWAARHLSDLRGVLPRCRTVDLMGDPNTRVSLTVVATDFTGDDSVLLLEVRGSETQYHAAVRQGDFEARLRIHTGATESQARAIVVNAGQRLCAASPNC